jgi:two-component system, chemotaxis family, response regulator Rcp1
MEESPSKRLILIVEDNPTHAQLIEQVLQARNVQHQIVAIADGIEAMNFLHRQDKYMDAATPDLILLDLNLPGKDGRTILAEIKTNPQLKRIPIIILTLSTDTGDIFQSYLLQGNCYVVKSSDPEQLRHIVERIEEFWLEIVTLPIK